MQLDSIQGFLWLVRQVFGLSSVPLLSIVSGYLAIVTLTNRPVTRQLVEKFRSLILPMIIWNLFALTKDVIEAGMLPSYSPLQWSNQIIAFDGFPRLTPLYFLRDVFICHVLLRLLSFCLATFTWPIIVLLILNALLNLDGRVFLNSHIPLFFSVGVYLAANGMTKRLTHWPFAFVGTISLVIIFSLAFIRFHEFQGLSQEPTESTFREILILLTRFAGACFFWSITSLAVKSVVGVRLSSYEPSIFLLFCAHPLLIGALWKVYSLLNRELWTLEHAAFFISVPFLSLVIVDLIRRLARDSIRRAQSGFIGQS